MKELRGSVTLAGLVGAREGRTRAVKGAGEEAGSIIRALQCLRGRGSPDRLAAPSSIVREANMWKAKVE